MILNKQTIIVLLTVLFFSTLQAQPIDDNNPVRKDVSLNSDWQTILIDSLSVSPDAGVATGETDNWSNVNIPHNWDDYGGYRRMVHGNLHASAMYKKEFELNKKQKDERYFFWFEGVGSYATVWLNGDSVGYHAGGRTSFTLDITNAINKGSNTLVVKAEHPADIRDLPWVCGGCSSEWGFCEGSQPLGIFRPVHLITTKEIRIEPFGVHIWNDNNITEKQAELALTIELKNYGDTHQTVRIENKLIDAKGNIIKKTSTLQKIEGGSIAKISQKLEDVTNPKLWSQEDPYLYTVETSVYDGSKLIDQLSSPYGIRWIKWDIHGDNPTNRFYLNGKPVLINGTCEYEHLMGRSHAFTDEMIRARVQQMLSAGYNSFRDAHQPHNLLYNKLLEENGILLWTQMSAHIWFDNPEFRKNFKTLLRDWVKERRNSPSVILWGLENESTLPKGFSEECSDIIRELDPTTSSQRLITTCNGGEGTDWNVVQNWSGTYGGNPWAYDEELSRQLLNGEYGAWRSIDLHTEGGFKQKGKWSEDRFNLLMESKIRLVEGVSDKICGQYHWLFNSHENPGRIQGGEGYRELDKIGPMNYKGLITPWGEMTDGYYLYRSNYVSANKEPMVYIVSHTWADRWLIPGIKDTIRVFSNCEEVELFSGVKEKSLGKLRNLGRGYHFIFNKANIENNVLYAVGYQNGKEVATDAIILNHLPEAENINDLAGNVSPLAIGPDYMYMVNCGGAEYTDSKGNIWQADAHWDRTKNHWGSTSWTDDYTGMPAFFGSQRQTNDPIKGTLDWKLIQSFRYGMHKLKYHFPVPDGKYTVDMYFIEPWYGTGGGMNCERWRIFDVAVNGETVIDDLDIWSEVGHDKLLKKSVSVDIKGGILELSFPEVTSGEAIISAIAISASSKEIADMAAPAPKPIADLTGRATFWSTKHWLNTGDNADKAASTQFATIAPKLYGAEWIQPTKIARIRELQFTLNEDANVFVALAAGVTIPEGFEFVKEQTITLNRDGGTEYILYKKDSKKGDNISLPAYSADEFALVALVPFTTLDDARDLRPSVTYPARDAINIGAGGEEVKWKKDSRYVSEDGAAIEWTFQTGLASKYGLEIRFSNPTQEVVHAHLTIESIDGRPMSEQDLIFEPSGNRWRSLRTDTGSIINAGTYKLEITINGELPLWFHFLKVQ